MRKDTYIGPAPPDDPMFSSGPEMFSRRESSGDSTLPTAPLPLSGSDPVIEHLRARGLPITQENWIQYAGLTEPLDSETEGYLLSLPLEEQPSTSATDQ
jgi:hypothetical protein